MPFLNSSKSTARVSDELDVPTWLKPMFANALEKGQQLQCNRCLLAHVLCFTNFYQSCKVKFHYLHFRQLEENEVQR